MDIIKDPGDLGSIPGHVIQKTLKMVLDTSLLNTQQYKVLSRASGEIQWKKSHHPLHLGVVAIEKGAFSSPSTTVVNLYILASSECIYIYIYISSLDVLEIVFYYCQGWYCE